MSKQHDRSLIIVAAQKGEMKAFDQIVLEYLDMAVAYGCSILTDVHAAEDAAQEAFIEAFQTLPTLRNPLAFAAWFRCIIFKHCDRHLRRKTLAMASLEGAPEVADGQSSPEQIMERAEFDVKIHRMIASLSERERAVTLLFYMSQRTYQDMAGFLNVPLSTIKKRLYSARQKLRTKMIDSKMIDFTHDLQEQRPSRDEAFAARIRATAQRVSTQYQPSLANASPASSTWGEALASRIRLQGEGAEATLDAAGDKASLWYGRPQDCLSVCENFAHLARHNQLLLLDMAAATSSDVKLPQGLFLERPRTMEAVWEFLLTVRATLPSRPFFA